MWALSILWRGTALLALYALFVALVRPAVYYSLSTAAAQNRMVAERFFVRAEVPEVVLVGSSMARQLEGGLRGGRPEVYDLSFFGGSPLTGNALILAGEAMPRLVVVEVNNLRQPLNDSFFGEVAGTPWRTLRRFCPILRTEYQPNRVLQSAARTLGNRISGSPLVRTPVVNEPPIPHLAEGVSLALADDMGWAPFYRVQAEWGLDHLAAQVAEFDRRGVRVLFLHLPLDPRLEADPYRRYAYAAAREQFPESRWPWIDLPSDGSFRTSDGVHLTEPSARRAVARIMQRVREELGYSAASPRS